MNGVLLFDTDIAESNVWYSVSSIGFYELDSIFTLCKESTIEVNSYYIISLLDDVMDECRKHNRQSMWKKMCL